jgi:DUF4097 and DUF4098 domain-containing protein YvlB
MMRLFKTTIVAAVALLLASPAVLADQDVFEWTGSVSPGQTVEIKGINGNIEVEASSGGAVVVGALKKGRRDDPRDVRIEVVEHAGGVTICAVYPDRGGRQNVCAPGDDGNLSAEKNDVSVNFSVAVPSGVELVAKTVNGNISAKDLDADAVARTVNGDIDVAALGVVRAATVNGNIDASMGRADWDDEIEFKTVNGNISVDLPANTSTEVSIKTQNGSISTAFPITISGKWVGKSARGTIGGGGRDLVIETVNGSVTLRDLP